VYENSFSVAETVCLVILDRAYTDSSDTASIES